MRKDLSKTIITPELVQQNLLEYTVKIVRIEQKSN